MSETDIPKAIESECALLGSMLIDPRCIGDVVGVIRSSEDFFEIRHGRLYDVLVGMYDSGVPVDMVQIKHRLEALGILENMGGVPWLVDLADGTPNATSAVYYASLVVDRSMRRRLIEVAQEAEYEARAGVLKTPDLIEQTEQRIFDLSTSVKSNTCQGLGDLLDEAYEKAEQEHGETVTGIETGFYDLDKITRGLHAKELTVLAARPSMGKTALMLNIASHLAFNGTPAVIYSMEMSRQMLAHRLMASNARVDAQRMNRNTLNQDEFGRLSTVVANLKSSGVSIDDASSLSILQIRARARRLCESKGIRAVFIDYLQLMTGPKSNNRQEEVSSISRGLKAMAMELGIPVFVLSQLNRASEMRSDNKPKMSDLRESGAIEQDADVVMLLHRDDYYKRQDDGYIQNNEAELIIAKHRNGPTGTVNLHFNGPSMRFDNAQRELGGMG